MIRRITLVVGTAYLWLHFGLIALKAILFASSSRGRDVSNGLEAAVTRWVFDPLNLTAALVAGLLGAFAAEVMHRKQKPLWGLVLASAGISFGVLYGRFNTGVGDMMLSWGVTMLFAIGWVWTVGRIYAPETTPAAVKMNPKRGFTIIELLVVLVIITLLAALLLPVFARAKRQSQQAVCASNLKQLGTATILYMDANNGLLPAEFMEDPRPIASLVKEMKVFICPSDDYKKGANVNATQAMRHRVSYYGVPTGKKMELIPIFERDNPNHTLWACALHGKRTVTEVDQVTPASDFQAGIVVRLMKDLSIRHATPTPRCYRDAAGHISGGRTEWDLFADFPPPSEYLDGALLPKPGSTPVPCPIK